MAEAAGHGDDEVGDDDAPEFDDDELVNEFFLTIERGRVDVDEVERRRLLLDEARR